jgi:hypothetical protein
MTGKPSIIRKGRASDYSELTRYSLTQWRLSGVDGTRLTKLAKLDEDEGHVVSERTVSPLSDTVQDGLLHLGKGFLC